MGILGDCKSRSLLLHVHYESFRFIDSEAFKNSGGAQNSAVMTHSDT